MVNDAPRTNDADVVKRLRLVPRKAKTLNPTDASPGDKRFATEPHSAFSKECRLHGGTHLAYLNHLAGCKVCGVYLDEGGLRPRHVEPLARSQLRYWRGFNCHIERPPGRDGE